MSVSDRVEEEAAGWVLRHPLSAEEERALEDWLAQDRRRAGVLLRVQAALSAVDRAIVVDPAEWVSPVKAVRHEPSRRWMLGGLGGAAATAAGISVLGWPRLRGERITTARGEIRRLPLVDGSVATIDTGSDLHLAMTGETRRVALAAGQAWFQVAKDRHRPFIVDAGIAQVRAVGTAFSVHRTEAGVQIAVTEGTVVAWCDDAKGAMSVLTAGQYATFTRGGDAPQTGTAPAAIERSLAWREGEISLEGETLGDAAITFNRYNRQQLVVDDPSLARERLVGLFKIGNPADFAATLERSIGVAVTVTPDEIRLSRKNRPPA